MLEIRTANAADATLILQFITDLATYEKAASEVIATEADIKNSLFADDSTTQAVICEIQGKPIGFAVYFFTYSTWLGKNGIYLEDLYVTPEYRGKGAGKVLLKYLAKLAVAKNCGRFEWRVLDWNEPARKFYESFGALPQSEWIGYRLDGEALTDFAGK